MCIRAFFNNVLVVVTSLIKYWPLSYRAAADYTDVFVVVTSLTCTNPNLNVQSNFFLFTYKVQILFTRIHIFFFRSIKNFVYLKSELCNNFKSKLNVKFIK